MAGVLPVEADIGGSNGKEALIGISVELRGGIVAHLLSWPCRVAHRLSITILCALLKLSLSDLWCRYNPPKQAYS